MSGGSSKSKSKSMSRSSGSSSTGVWDDQSQYLNQLYAGASEDLANPRQYGADRYAGIGAQTERAIGGSLGTYGENVANIGAAGQQFRDTMGGKYLDPESNPNLRAQFDVGARGITREYMGAVQSLGSRMEASGRSGSGVGEFRGQRDREALATGLGDFSAKLYGDAYAQERGIQAGMTGQAGQIAGAGWQNVAGLSSMGDREQLNRQSELDDQNQRFQYSQNIRGEQLAQFRDMIGGPTMVSEAEESSFSKSKSKGKQKQGGFW